MGFFFVKKFLNDELTVYVYFIALMSFICFMAMKFDFSKVYIMGKTSNFLTRRATSTVWTWSATGGTIDYQFFRKGG